MPSSTKPRCSAAEGLTRHSVVSARRDTEGRPKKPSSLDTSSALALPTHTAPKCAAMVSGVDPSASPIKSANFSTAFSATSARPTLGPLHTSATSAASPRPPYSALASAADSTAILVLATVNPLLRMALTTLPRYAMALGFTSTKVYWRCCWNVCSVKLSPYSTTLSWRLNTVMVAPMYRSAGLHVGTFTFFRNVRRFLMSYISMLQSPVQYSSW
mmetsp:Transcript_21041/g.52323  ORF Transcript_21041/g.52323 Transcript_21041/m.52323 type:complete len:215 (-) Transcript_21041:106-750(-)